MAKNFFVAGTDTDVGKTAIAAGLVAAANLQGLRTVGMKPIAAGCELTADGLRNEDALLLQSTMTQKMPYEQVNPVAFAEPIAPHIAAEKVSRQVTARQLVGFARGFMMQPADFRIIEGAGGWRVPLNHRETLADCVRELNIPVILVVGMKLGCLNHALLTAETIIRDGLPLAGWVANSLDATPMPYFEENIISLENRLAAPCLGKVPYLPQISPEKVAQYLDINTIL